MAEARIALFRDPDRAAEALDLLREKGIPERDMTVLSGFPYPPQVLGRPMVWERLPLISLSGALVGFLIGIFLNVVTPFLYPVSVGGQPQVPIPPTLVLTYEFTMMGLIVSTFLGVLWQSAFPSFGPRESHPKVADGRIGLLFSCPEARLPELTEALLARGAEAVVEPRKE